MSWLVSPVIAHRRAGAIHGRFFAANILLFALFFFALPALLFAIGQEQYVETVRHADGFTIAQGALLATIYVDADDHAGVVRAARDLQTDLFRVTDCRTAIIDTVDPGAIRGANLIIVGTIGKSAAIDRLIREKKVDVSGIAGKWETFLIQTVARPFPGIANGLIIAGSDKRGTIYGIYDLSEQIGVSPWYWWADVPVQHKDTLFVKPGRYTEGPPKVKYRGIFLNDEAPSLTGWVHDTFGNYNHQFYEKIFELLLRLKANYLWPAMWDNAFNEDDPLNPQMADMYGIVMGTSHHEPMLRAQQEWKRHGTGPWDYSTNSEVLQKFWTEGIQRNKNYESIITLGMRGDGDLPMTEGANIALLEQIMADQRKIIASQVNPDLSTVAQDWALYKDVQEYYENGMRVPDDVTLLWCDDNWGNLRRLPTAEERKRSGGAGIYYHFDYVGDPRSYKWVNTVPITKIWEQMNLAYSYGANRIWIVNVGDLKPMEFPMEFFLTLAWDPEKWPKERLPEYSRMWAQREFGAKYASEITGIIAKYTKYNGRRKPELIEPDTFNLVDYQEADRVLVEWQTITRQAETIYASLPTNEQDAFFELVLYPVKACTQVAELYVAIGKNHLYASQGRASTNDLAAKARALFQADADLSAEYNHNLSHGKWNHMMDQTHIGYTGWHDPPANVMPAVVEREIPVSAGLGVAVEGSALAWPTSVGNIQPALPPIDAFNRQRRYIDIFNRGRTSFEFTARSSQPWIRLSVTHGVIEKNQRLWVSVDWCKAPKGSHSGVVILAGADASPVPVMVSVLNREQPTRASLRGFVEADGYVSVEAAHFTNKIDTASAKWEEIEDYGRTLSSMTIFPVTAPSVTPLRDSPCLEYRMYLFNAGKVQVEAILAPTLNFDPGRGLRYAIAFDDEPPQIVDALSHNSLADWATAVKKSVRKVRSAHTLAAPGYHTLKFWMVDPGVVLQKLIIDTGGVKASYLGPPESYHNIASK
jgi:hypothetical protein